VDRADRHSQSQQHTPLTRRSQIRRPDPPEVERHAHVGVVVVLVHRHRLERGDVERHQHAVERQQHRLRTGVDGDAQLLGLGDVVDGLVGLDLWGWVEGWGVGWGGGEGWGVGRGVCVWVS